IPNANQVSLIFAFLERPTFSLFSLLDWVIYEALNSRHHSFVISIFYLTLSSGNPFFYLNIETYNNGGSHYPLDYKF
ncbi:MAG: hypothetical protein ACFFDT_28565, partial [Candidatus Hodarchaeota archaeon]